MAKNIDDPWKRFIALSEPNLSRNCYAHVSCICRKDDGQLENLNCCVILSPMPTIEGPTGSNLLDAEGLVAFRDTVPPEKVQGLLEGLRAGLVPPELLSTGAGLPLSLHEYQPLCRDKFTAAEHLNLYPVPVAAFLLEAEPSGSTRFFVDGQDERLERSLPSCDPPYNDLDGLVRDLAIGHRWSRRPRLCIVSPMWLEIGVAEQVETGEIVMQVLTRWQELRGDVSVALLPRSPAYLHHKALMTVASPDWECEKLGDGPYSWTSRVAPKQPIGPCDVVVNYRDRKVDSARTGLPNTRVLAHQFLDPDFRALEKRLGLGDNKKPKADQFEEGVAWLLHLCGMSAAHYGHKDMQRAPDILAFTENFRVLFAECTIEPPSLDKVKNLRSRAAAYQKRVIHHYGVEIFVQPALFVAFPEEELTDGELESIHDLDCVVVGTTGMNKLIEGAFQGEDAESMFFSVVVNGREWRATKTSLQ